MSKPNKYLIYKREYNNWEKVYGFVDKVKIDYVCTKYSPEAYIKGHHNLVTPEPVSYREALALIKLLPKERESNAYKSRI